MKILFVCMGNICRSPAADGIMVHMVQEAGLSDEITIDSAGTGGWHAGQPADRRMRAHAKARGYDLPSIARQVEPNDFVDFDLILVMDQQNQRDIREFAPKRELMAKVRQFCDYAKDRPEHEVPDPYYGGDAGFEQVLDIVENGCKHLLEEIQSRPAGIR
jgi:protein-tyrosine phosphatase